jgi:hypothetical protein
MWCAQIVAQTYYRIKLQDGSKDVAHISIKSVYFCGKLSPLYGIITPTTVTFKKYKSTVVLLQSVLYIARPVTVKPTSASVAAPSRCRYDGTQPRGKRNTRYSETRHYRLKEFKFIVVEYFKNCLLVRFKVHILVCTSHFSDQKVTQFTPLIHTAGSCSRVLVTGMPVFT